MATITRDAGSYADNLVRFQYDYDDVTLRVTAFRCINDSNQPAWGRATMLSNGRSYERIFDAQTTTAISVPTGQATRLQLFVNAAGKLDGVQIETAWPAP